MLRQWMWGNPVYTLETIAERMPLLPAMMRAAASLVSAVAVRIFRTV
jgi:hypothetical protein